MARVVIDVRKSIEANAADYFEKAKKARKKLEGARAALEKSRHKLGQMLLRQETDKRQFAAAAAGKKVAEARQRGREWYEKFRWFISSEGFLCIGGRDATTNEIIVKKHADSADVVFHTEMSGSPFFAVKAASGKGPIGESTLRETAAATASFSMAWKAGLQSVEVYWVKPEQVSKEARAGEYLTKGAFMIYGRKNYIPSNLEVAIGLTEAGKVMAGPVEAVSAHCSKFVKLIQGDLKPSDTAKKIEKLFGLSGYLDEIIRALPTGEFKIVEN